MEPRILTVTVINGDYAELVSEEGTPHTVALALLPPETDVGRRIRWELFEYSLAE